MEMIPVHGGGTVKQQEGSFPRAAAHYSFGRRVGASKAPGTDPFYHTENPFDGVAGPRGDDGEGRYSPSSERNRRGSQQKEDFPFQQIRVVQVHVA